MAGIEKRIENRSFMNQYYSVNISLNSIDSNHQFVLWDRSPQGLSFLIEEDATVLSHISVGDVFKMKYFPIELLGDTKCIKTQIRHITKHSKGHGKYRKVGLLILEEENSG